MSTAIKSSELDFFELRDNLKLFLQQQDQFEDYDFEGSALSNLLDVLAHNTHFNALLSNFALNESYLTSAQLRSSIVSIAESLGYIPDSRTSAQASVSITINLAGVPDLQPQYSVLPGALKLRGTIDDNSFVFSNRVTMVAETSGDGIYNFRPFENEDDPVIVYEGEERSLQYPVDGTANSVYVIPDENIDISTTIVKLYDTISNAKSASSAYRFFTDVFSATTIDIASRLYILRESPNKFYELTFGDNNSLGETPVAGNVIDINYLRTSGSEANGVASLRMLSTISDLFDIDPSAVSNITPNVTVLSRAAGGVEREGIESIRKRAPFQYAAQNRMVTSLDHEALILRKYSNFIEDIISWGGEEDYRRDYGSVYTSIIWKEDLSSTSIGQLRNDIRELVKSLSTVSFQIKFIAPSETWISTEVYYQYSPVLSALSESGVNRVVKSTVDTYFENNTGKFQQNFRRSKLLTVVDDADPSILSSRADVRMQQRIQPILTLTENHELSFPVAIKSPTDTETTVVKTSLFQMNNQTVYIRNKLTDRVKVSKEGQVPIVFERRPSTKLEVVNMEGNVVVSNIGSYDPESGVVSISGLNVQSILSSFDYIKVFATPANESVVESQFSSILNYDAHESVIKAVTVTARV